MAKEPAVVSGGLGVASVAIQVEEKIFQLQRFLDAVKPASPEIQSCLEEIKLLNEILLDWEATSLVPPDDARRKYCAELCRRTAALISELLNESRMKIRERTSRGSAEFVLKRSELDRMLVLLERIKSTLCIAHLVNQRRLQAQWAAQQDNAIQMAIAQTTSKASQTSSKSSLPSLSLAESQHNTSRQPAFRVALTTWLSGKVWEIYTGQCQIKWAFRMRTYNVIPSDSLIFQYAAGGDVGGLKCILQQKQASVLDCNDLGLNALMLAARDGQVETAGWLLDAGVDPCATTRSGLTALHLSSAFVQTRNWDSPSIDELIDSDRLDFTLKLIRKTQDLIIEKPECFITMPNAQLFRSVLNSMQPPFHQRSLLERIELCSYGIGCFGCKAEDPLLILTAEEKENIHLYRDQILPLILKCCWETLRYFPRELDGYHLLLTRVFYNYSDRLRDDHAGSNPPWSLIILCLQSWLSCGAGLHEKLRTRRLTPSRQWGTPIQMLVRAIQAAGVDLLELGRAETSVLAKGLVDQDLGHLIYSGDSYGGDFVRVTTRVTGFSYGPEPQDWHCWFSDRTDEYAGEFWGMAEK